MGHNATNQASSGLPAPPPPASNQLLRYLMPAGTRYTDCNRLRE